VTKHFFVAKKYCAQWQLKGSRCLTPNVCTIFIGFTQRDNCTMVISYYIEHNKSLSSKLLSFLSSLYSECSFVTQTWKITEITEKKLLIYGHDLICNRSILECNAHIAHYAYNLYVKSHNQLICNSPSNTWKCNIFTPA